MTREYRSISIEALGLESQPMTPLRVNLASWLKWIAWSAIVFFGLCTVLGWRVPPPGLSLVFLFFVALGIFLLLFLGPLEMNTQFIRHTTILGRWQMDWDEIKTIEVAPKEGGDMVLHGQGKRMAIPGTALWSGEDKREMVGFFNAQVGEREIEVKRTVRASLQMSKNTKVK